MSAFKHNVEVEYSVHSVHDLESKRQRGNRARSKVPASSAVSQPAVSTAQLQAKVNRAAPGLRPPERRPVSAGVLGQPVKRDKGNDAANINLADANKRGAASLVEKKLALSAGQKRPVTQTNVSAVVAQNVIPVNGTNYGEGNSDSNPGQIRPHILPQPRPKDPLPKRRPVPPARRHQLEHQLEVDTFQNRPQHPNWNNDPRAPDRDLLILEQDDAIHRKKHGNGNSSPRPTNAEGLQTATKPIAQPNEESQPLSGAANKMLISRTPREVTPADVYAPHRIRSTKHVSGVVVNGQDKALFFIAKQKVEKHEEKKRHKSPQRDASPPPTGASPPVPASGRARHKHHHDHDNIRNHVIHCDTANGHLGNHAENTKGRPYGIHDSPWNFSEVSLEYMLAEERLLPTPVNRLVPMYPAGKHAASQGAKNANAPVSGPIVSKNVEQEKEATSVKEVIFKERSLSDFPDHVHSSKSGRSQ